MFDTNKTGELKVLIFMEKPIPYIVDKMFYTIQHLVYKIVFSTLQSVRSAWEKGNPQAEHFWLKNGFMKFAIYAASRLSVYYPNSIILLPTF